jgi:hypothetical protein
MNPAALVGLLSSALELIAAILERGRARRETASLDSAADELTAISVILAAVKGGSLGEADLEKAEADLSILRQAIMGADEAADAAVRAKFGTSPKVDSSG